MNDEITRESFAQMEENRGQMIKVKQWFQFVIITELIFAVYMAGFSLVSIAGIIFAAAAAAYAFTVNKKNEKICTAGFAVHVLAAVFVIISSGVTLSEIMALDSSGDSAAVMAVDAVSHFTSVSAEDLDSGAVDLAFLVKGLKTAASVNMFCAVVVSLLPVIMNFRAIAFCRKNEELSAQPGYPYFNRDVEFANAVKAVDRVRRIRENAEIRELTGYEPDDNDDYYIYGDVSNENSERWSGLLERFSDRAVRDPEYVRELACKVTGIKYFAGHSKKRKDMENLAAMAEQMRNDRMNYEKYAERLKASGAVQNPEPVNPHVPDSSWNTVNTDLASSMLSGLDE